MIRVGVVGGMPPLSVLSLCDEGSRLPLETSLPRGAWVKLGGLPLLWIHMGVHVVPLKYWQSLWEWSPEAPFLWVKQKRWLHILPWPGGVLYCDGKKPQW